MPAGLRIGTGQYGVMSLGASGGARINRGGVERSMLSALLLPHILIMPPIIRQVQNFWFRRGWAPVSTLGSFPRLDEPHLWRRY
jgi:hypothetical protein